MIESDRERRSCQRGQLDPDDEQEDAERHAVDVVLRLAGLDAAQPVAGVQRPRAEHVERRRPRGSGRSSRRGARSRGAPRGRSPRTGRRARSARRAARRIGHRRGGEALGVDRAAAGTSARPARCRPPRPRSPAAEPARAVELRRWMLTAKNRRCRRTQRQQPERQRHHRRQASWSHGRRRRVRRRRAPCARVRACRGRPPKNAMKTTRNM